MLTLHREGETEANIVKKKTSNRRIPEATNRSSRISEEGITNSIENRTQTTDTFQKLPFTFEKQPTEAVASTRRGLKTQSETEHK